MDASSQQRAPNLVASAASLEPADSRAATPAKERAALLARLDPWRSAAALATPQYLQSAYVRSLLDLPRETKADAASDSFGPALLTAFGSTALALFLLLSISGPVLPWLVCAALPATLWFIPSRVYRANRDGLIRRWEQVYRETYLALCETGIAALIVDEEFWRMAFSYAPVNAAMKYVGLGPPKSPQEAVRMAAAFWPYLVAYQLGQHDALAVGIYDGYGTYAAAGPDLLRGLTDERFELRARAAAIVDFLFEPPEEEPGKKCG